MLRNNKQVKISPSSNTNNINQNSKQLARLNFRSQNNTPEHYQALEKQNLNHQGQQNQNDMVSLITNNYYINQLNIDLARYKEKNQQIQNQSHQQQAIMKDQQYQQQKQQQQLPNVHNQKERDQLIQKTQKRNLQIKLNDDNDFFKQTNDFPSKTHQQLNQLDDANDHILQLNSASTKKKQSRNISEDLAKIYVPLNSCRSKSPYYIKETINNKLFQTPRLSPSSTTNTNNSNKKPTSVLINQQKENVMGNQEDNTEKGQSTNSQRKLNIRNNYNVCNRININEQNKINLNLNNNSGDQLLINNTNKALISPLMINTPTRQGSQNGTIEMQYQLHQARANAKNSKQQVIQNKRSRSSQRSASANRGSYQINNQSNILTFKNKKQITMQRKLQNILGTENENIQTSRPIKQNEHLQNNTLKSLNKTVDCRQIPQNKLIEDNKNTYLEHQDILQDKNKIQFSIQRHKTPENKNIDESLPSTPCMEKNIYQTQSPQQGLKLKCCIRTKKGFISSNPNKVNQDAFICCQEINNQPWQHFFCICDGHGVNGHLVSNYLKESTPKLLSAKTINEDYNPRVLLTEYLEEVCNQLYNDSKIDINFSGSTFVSVFFHKNSLFCANVGDSRAIIGKQIGDNNKWSVMPLSRDHKPIDQEEAKRIIASGGRIDAFRDPDGNQIGPLRVWMKEENIPGLAMTRSIGDLVAASLGVSNKPEIVEYKYTDFDKIVVIGSDGLFEFIENKDIIKMIVPFYLINDIESASDYLIQEANNRWQRECNVIDDITFIIIFIYQQ